ncbi:carbohydrate-binding protein, partial [Methylocystis sp. H62]|uniref:hypothetical protein n=1 Tax=Methylocystis sp. H62 TaxID=2785789 RepID=UPI001A22FFEF
MATISGIQARFLHPLALVSLLLFCHPAVALWQGWESMGGVILDKPECASWGPGHLHCFARGTDGAMYGKWWTGSGWGGWENMGGVLLNKPECVTWGPGHLHCFGRGTDGAMYGKWWTGSGWGGWE